MHIKSKSCKLKLIKKLVTINISSFGLLAYISDIFSSMFDLLFLNLKLYI